jgi:predicted DNA-binding transcriptional regulator AlpA
MSEIVITTREDITEIVKAAVLQAINVIIPKPKEEPDRFDINGAVEYLKSRGIKISKSHLYKMTPDGSAPVRRFGGRLVFYRQDLETWAESRLKSNNSNEVAQAVANSINRKNRS